VRILRGSLAARQQQTAHPLNMNTTLSRQTKPATQTNWPAPADTAEALRKAERRAQLEALARELVTGFMAGTAAAFFVNPQSVEGNECEQG